MILLLKLVPDTHTVTFSDLLLLMDLIKTTSGNCRKKLIVEVKEVLIIS